MTTVNGRLPGKSLEDAEALGTHTAVRRSEAIPSAITTLFMGQLWPFKRDYQIAISARRLRDLPFIVWLEPIGCVAPA